MQFMKPQLEFRSHGILRIKGRKWVPYLMLFHVRLYLGHVRITSASRPLALLIGLYLCTIPNRPR